MFWDLETTHNIAAVFNLFSKDYIPHGNILQERYIVCASWMFLGSDKIHSVSVLDDPKRFKKNPHDDYFVVDTVATTIANEADVIVAHNGDQYDKKFLAGRMLLHKMKPLPPVTTIDTLKICKNNFLLNSNRLDYIAGKLLGEGKLKTDPGLWLKVLAGEKKSIQDMVQYNRVDTKRLRDTFVDHLLPYIPNLNQRLYGTEGCTKCGSTNVQRRGEHVALTRTYQRFQCQDCGGWYREGKPERSTSARGL